MREKSGRFAIHGGRSWATAWVLALPLLGCAGASTLNDADAQATLNDRGASDREVDGATPIGAEPVSATIADAPEPAPRERGVTAVNGFEKIYLKPDIKSPLIGLFRAGQTVPFANPEPMKGPGVGLCKGGFYAVKPRGFVCVTASSTLDPDDPRALAAAEVLPDSSQPMPFKVGVMMASSPQYTRIPTPEEQHAEEKDLDKWLALLQSGKVPEGPGKPDASPAGHGPSPRVAQYLEAVKPGLKSEEDAYEARKMAFVGEIDAAGRTFLLTPDLTFVPKDKVRFVDAPRLEGVDLTKSELKFPFAYAWIGDAAKLKKSDSGFVETGDAWPRQSFLQIEGQLVQGRGGPYWKTADGTYVRNDQITIFKRRTDRPKGVGPKDKWIDVRITWGTLVAYEGDTPIFATAVSPGQDGITARSNGHNTARGLQSVGWKLLSADMSGVEKNKPWAVDEVPFVAYYKDSFALHGAWWHDDFGRPKSHGCVNIAPTDARRLFNWMEPGMPKGWYAVAAYYPDVRGTVIDIRP